MLRYRVHGGPDARAERLPGQCGTSDSRPGDRESHSVWRYRCVIVPADHAPDTPRSEEDVLRSGCQVIQTDTYAL